MKSCVLCNRQAFPFMKVKSYVIFQCKKCSHCFTYVAHENQHVSAQYSDSYFFDGGVGYPNYLRESEILIKHGERYAEIIKEFQNPGSLLDVGCAAGFMMKGFENKGWEVEGIEPNKTMCQYAKNELNLNVQENTFENFDSLKKYDLVTLIQIMGHFIDPKVTLSKLSKIVKPGGWVLVETWDYSSFFARIQGKSWHEFSPPSVLQWFSQKSLDQLFHNYHFEKIKTGRPTKKIQMGHVKSLLEEKYGGYRAFNVLNWGLGVVSDEIEVPYPSFDLFYSIFKNNLNIS